MHESLLVKEEILMAQLQKIADNEFEVPTDIEPFQLIKEVCKHLGSPNPVLRDELGYSLLVQWVYKRNILNEEQLRELYSIIISDNMWFNGIGEINTDSVLTRSFSSLVVALLLLVASHTHFLTIAEWEELLMRTCDYCALEKDVRGYDQEKGWLHAAAHVADVLNAFAKHPNFTNKHADYILKAIIKVMDNTNHVFQYEEDERLARGITNLVENKHLNIVDLMNWFEQINIDDSTYMVSMTKRINWKHLFRSVISQLAKRRLISVPDDLLGKNRFNSPYI